MFVSESICYLFIVLKYQLNYGKNIINRVINNKDIGAFVDMYPDRSLYSILPKYNKYRNSKELYEILEKGAKEATKYASNKIEQVRNNAKTPIGRLMK